MINSTFIKQAVKDVIARDTEQSSGAIPMLVAGTGLAGMGTAALYGNKRLGQIADLPDSYVNNFKEFTQLDPANPNKYIADYTEKGHKIMTDPITVGGKPGTTWDAMKLLSKNKDKINKYLAMAQKIGVDTTDINIDKLFGEGNPRHFPEFRKGQREAYLQMVKEVPELNTKGSTRELINHIYDTIDPASPTAKADLQQYLSTNKLLKSPIPEATLDDIIQTGRTGSSSSFLNKLYSTIGSAPTQSYFDYAKDTLGKGKVPAEQLTSFLSGTNDSALQHIGKTLTENFASKEHGTELKWLTRYNKLRKGLHLGGIGALSAGVPLAGYALYDKLNSK